jgi:hypothetical protein
MSTARSLGVSLALIHMVQTMADELDTQTGGNAWMATMRTTTLALLDSSEFNGFSEHEERSIREAAKSAVSMVLSGAPVSDLLSEIMTH